ncbi:MAG: iron-sulfur cluster assembly accessory protein [Xanthomonadales bacterium]|nr:iron-sulfur cluster assembly accessory protein [Xanthomonadales bacterium]
MAISLAPAALDRIRGYLAADPAALGLRFGVRRTGCSGWGYAVDLARDRRDGDVVSEQDGIRIFVDAYSLPMVDGTEIDFLKQGLNEQFVFRNPNVAGECGCGSSFTTDADRAA